jgi:endonuclease VIII
MPEGDTIHTLARVLRDELEGRTLERVEVRGRPAPSLAIGVRAVEARGKNLLIELASGEVIRSHLGMHGDWHRYPAEATAWKKPARRASLVLRTADIVLVCFDAGELEFLETGRLGRSRRLRGLGPDLLGAPVAPEALVARARSLQRPAAPVVDLLLDQRVAAGIGNVYKSEVLFLRGIHPLAKAGALADQEIAALFQLAGDLLRANVGGRPRTTTEGRRRGPVRGSRLWVYGRAGRPCLRCGAAIAFAALGRGRRSTYWCPACQSEGEKKT